MADDYQIEIHKVPMLDTGIGRQFGYESDAALIEASKAERATWPAEMREAVEQYEAEFMHRVMFRSAAPPRKDPDDV
jgi:hypothetical protein